ncbi:MAG: hypothetical protein ACRC0V_09240 [Fusobacteriaceae bacterium]
MSYDNENEYNYALQCEAENDAKEAHFNYMNELIDSKNYEIFAIEYCLDLLNSKSYTKGFLDYRTFLENKLFEKKIIKEKGILEIARLKKFNEKFDTFEKYFSDCPERIGQFSKIDLKYDLQGCFRDKIEIENIEKSIADQVPF